MIFRCIAVGGVLSSLEVLRELVLSLSDLAEASGTFLSVSGGGASAGNPAGWPVVCGAKIGTPYDICI